MSAEPKGQYFYTAILQKAAPIQKYTMTAWSATEGSNLAPST